MTQQDGGKGFRLGLHTLQFCHAGQKRIYAFVDHLCKAFLPRLGCHHRRYRVRYPGKLLDAILLNVNYLRTQLDIFPVLGLAPQVEIYYRLLQSLGAALEDLKLLYRIGIAEVLQFLPVFAAVALLFKLLCQSRVLVSFLELPLSQVL